MLFDKRIITLKRDLLGGDDMLAGNQPGLIRFKSHHGNLIVSVVQQSFMHVADRVKRLETINPEAPVDRHLMTFDPCSVEQVVIKLADNDYTVPRKGKRVAMEESP